ncbi:MAG TPA: hypothetical protein VFZ61_12665, partial [Polyangiales bacterium]
MKTVPSFCPQVIAAAAVACTAWCAGAPSAGACSRIAISYSLAASAVPVTGSIVIDAQCIEEYCESVQPELLVTLDG